MEVLKKIFELIALLPKEMQQEVLKLFAAKWNKIITDNNKNQVESQVSQKNGVRKLPEQNPRVETGKIKFGDDWAGIFFRGDDATWYGALLKNKFDGSLDPAYDFKLKELVDILMDVKD